MAFASTVASGATQGKTHKMNDPLVRADKSFSDVRLNEKAVPQKIGRLVNADCDDDMILCEWQDDGGIRYILAGRTVAIKFVNASDFNERPIPALGIGTARLQSDVVARVRSFLPEIQIDCLAADEAGEGEGISSCGGAFAAGPWFKLLFDRRGRLISARIDAFQIN